MKSVQTQLSDLRVAVDALHVKLDCIAEGMLIFIQSIPGAEDRLKKHIAATHNALKPLPEVVQMREWLEQNAPDAANKSCERGQEPG